MPTYDYRCGACKHEFEEFQSIKAAALTKCPACGKNKLERLIGTGGAIIFKGSGFYQTDYRSKSYTDAAKKDAPAAPASSSSAESKPAATASTPATTPATPSPKPEKPAKKTTKTD